MAASSHQDASLESRPSEDMVLTAQDQHPIILSTQTIPKSLRRILCASDPVKRSLDYLSGYRPTNDQQRQLSSDVSDLYSFEADIKETSSSETNSENFYWEQSTQGSLSSNTDLRSSISRDGRPHLTGTEQVEAKFDRMSLKSDEHPAGDATFSIASLEVPPEHSVNAIICTAWSIIVASIERMDIVKLAVGQVDGLTSHKDIPINWAACAQDLAWIVHEQLGDWMPAVAHQSSGRHSCESCDKPSYSQTFHIALPLSASQSYNVSEGNSTIAQGSQEAWKERLWVQCCIKDTQIYLSILTDESSAGESFLPHISRQFEYIIRKLCSTNGLDGPLVDLKAITMSDLEQIWSWNACVPPVADQACIHEIFMARARRHPHLLAISAHDGEMTYGELDGLSTRLAALLCRQGVQPQQTIIILIEKSKYVPLAQIAVMKTGCASVLLDASLPHQRQQVISHLVKPRMVIASPKYKQQAAELSPECASFILHSSSSKHWPSIQATFLPAVSPTWKCYIVFTSGSTGTPKGAVITHSNYASAVATQQQGLDFKEYDRVFDFASYAFDAAWCNFIHAMTIGGCLCIPSDEERKGDLAAALRKYQPNYAVLTPSVAWFSASELPASLRTFHFGGETLKKDLVRELSKTSRVINAYGPAECSTVTTAVDCDPNIDKDPSIGRGLGCCTWITRLDGSDLVPIGDIGELWVEGPIVGQGYLDEPKKSADAFVEDPSWLVRGSLGHRPGRQGTLYRTGDLVRYSLEGDLIFVGRKDSQVKIRGQRVELGEIEYNLERALGDEAKAHLVQILPEVIKPKGSDVPTLIAFMFVAVTAGVSPTEAGSILSQALNGIEDCLTKLVPPYMVPSAFLPITTVPMTPTGKVNRKLLRETGPEMYWQQLESQTALDVGEAQSETQVSIRQIWARILNLPLSKIRLDSTFTRLGGDSITAMQVVSRCRQQNLGITVADVLRLQTVRKLAASSKSVQHQTSKLNLHYIEHEAWALSPIQQLYFDNKTANAHHYTLSYIVRLRIHASYEVLLAALLRLIERHPMLRARFRMSVDGTRWEQYVAPSEPTSISLEQHKFVDRQGMQRVVDMRQALIHPITGPVFAVDVFNSPTEDQTLLMSAHHLVMDLVSWRIVWHELTQDLSGASSLQGSDLSFQAWCRLQHKEGEKLTPHIVLPFSISPANFQYWDVRPGTVTFKDSALDIRVIDEGTTELLLGSSNDCLRTEILDILIGTLVFCFAQTFSDRAPPPVFLEGHGREPPEGASGLDLGETIGWFTSIHPVEVGNISYSSIIDAIKFAKDNRRRVPSKGRPYFASRYYSEEGRRTFQAHKDIELLFNYRGLFQQLEDVNSMFRYEDRPERKVFIIGEGPDYQRPSLIDMNLVIEEGKLQIWTRSHKPMKNHQSVISWIDSFADTLRSVAHKLGTLPACYTVMDFPLLNISYAGLDSLMTEQLARHGILDADIQDIYPCTSMQNGMLISATLGAASYRIGAVWRACTSGITVNINRNRLAAAWHTVSRMHPVLSTLFSTNPETGSFVQIVLATPNEATLCAADPLENAVQHLEKMTAVEPFAGRPHCFFTICTDAEDKVACRLDISHALIDALSLPMLVRDLEKAYCGESLPITTPFRDVVEYIQSTSTSAKLSYWKKFLAGIEPCVFPGDIRSPRSSHSVQHDWTTLPVAVTGPIAQVCRQMNITRSAFLQIAWSFVLSYITGMRDVCFGYLASGRDCPVEGVEEVVGPLLNMLIARVNVGQPLTEVMSKLETYTAEHLENQHISLAEIQHEMSTRQLFNTNITVRQNRETSSDGGRNIRLVETSERDPHEVSIIQSCWQQKYH